MNHRVYFQASLSNGETITEGKGAYTVTTGDLSPWQKLLKHLEQQQAHITSLSLATADGRRWNLPSAGANPKFREFTDAKKPSSFRMFRKLAMEAMSIEEMSNAQEQEIHTCIEATYDDGRKIQVWVSEDTLASWSVLV